MPKHSDLIIEHLFVSISDLIAVSTGDVRRVGRNIEDLIDLFENKVVIQVCCRLVFATMILLGVSILSCNLA